MKITPINFTTYLEPPLLRFWKDQPNCQGKKVELQRSHNLNLAQTSLNMVAKETNGASSLLGSIQLVQIPQQEHNPALNALIHLPHIDHPTQLLMVFKAPEDTTKWAERLVQRIESLMATASEAKTLPDASGEATVLDSGDSEGGNDTEAEALPDADEETA